MHHFTFRRLLICLSLVALAPQPATAAVSVGDTVDFKMKTAEGQAFTAEDLRGRLVVVEFWATWCGPCIQMIPHLKEMNRNYQNRGVTMISVSTDRDARDAKRMIAQKKMDWTMVLNAEQDRSLTAHFFAGSYSIPNAFLVSPEGEVLWNGHPARLEAQLKDALKNHPPDADGGAARRGGGNAGAAADPETPEGIADAAVDALRERNPDFQTLFRLLESLPEAALEEPVVLRRGRAVARALGRLTDEQNEGLALYRETYPERAQLLDAWVEAATNAELGQDPDAPTREVHPAVLTRKLAEAKTAAANEDMVTAYDSYRWIIDRAPDSSAAAAARPVVEELEADAEFMAAYEKAVREAEAESGLTMARNLVNADMDDAAAEAYREVIEHYGDTDAARAARRELRNLR